MAAPPAPLTDLPLGPGVRHIDLADGPFPDDAPEPMLVGWRDGLPVAHRLRGPDGVTRSVEATRPAAPLPSAPPPCASVVICTRDRPAELRRCLASLPDQTLVPAEVIVVDNASRTAETRAVAEAAGAVYVREDRPGLDFARNAGALRASGEIVAYTDDDVVLHPRWLEALVASFTSPAVGGVTGLVLPAELASEAQLHFETYWSFGRGYDPIDFPASLVRGPAAAAFQASTVGAGASMAFRRSVFAEAGLFDERLDVGQAGCSGDSEYWYRLLARGFDCRYEPRSVAFHYHRRGMDGLASQLRAYMRGNAASLLIQYEDTGMAVNRRRALVWLPRWYAGRLRRRLTGRRVPDDRFLRQEVAGYLSGLLFYWRHRRPVRHAG
ncbi:glycosyltransferase [Sphingomonas ginkgonis]|uniref:Glycosyltransferase n=1 Tax=Sphingomonas ginkgonis TaxID=2315330 RepID=A0A3R9Z716_9SPHN|nr:glycosyltransferase [Sphingomonas ginkgonis]RST31397.1 glycosyltransferase [Sphingomonas ginkgonis]